MQKTRVTKDGRTYIICKADVAAVFTLLKTERFRNTNNGICAHIIFSVEAILDVPQGILYQVSEEFERFLFDNCISWKEFSGRLIYPIPSGDVEIDPYNYYHSSRNKWEGRQGELRQSLLDHLIKKAKTIKVQL